MANGSAPPFFQLGRRVSFRLLQGGQLEEITGEVMDTDAGWIAVRGDHTQDVEWFNLDYIVRIRALDRIRHE